MPTWFKFLTLIALLIVGASAGAYAHGGEEHVPHVAAQTSAAGQGDEAQPAEFYFEQSGVKLGGSCNCDCCCTGGTMHCSSGACAASALSDNGQNSLFRPSDSLMVFADYPLMHAASLIFGLDRPPKV